MEGGQEWKEIGGVYSIQKWSSRFQPAIRVYFGANEQQTLCLSQERTSNGNLVSENRSFAVSRRIQRKTNERRLGHRI